jgi:hypothetical protein
MAKSSIGIAESLAGLFPSTIFELRGEWRRLLRRRRDSFEGVRKSPPYLRSTKGTGGAVVQ